tara:strand:+ start:141305 stop:142162 length:858 start_codon:yes stop_codon:yes gene_type:complete
MAILKRRRPLTPGQRFLVENKRTELTRSKPERSLTESRHSPKGRNCYGRITSRRRGGGHKRRYRHIDFRRDKLEIPARVKEIEYDPNRTANIALLAYRDGEKRYIIAPQGLKVGDEIISTNSPLEEYLPGMCLPLKLIPPGTRIHALELEPGSGARMARGAGVGVDLMGIDGERATVKLPSGEIRLLHSNCRATIGTVGNATHQGQKLGKAGRNRWKGKRPRVRGVAMNPVDHPNGGGEGRTSGGGHNTSPWGILAKGGFLTRKKAKASNKMILIRRNGKKVRKG